MLATWVKTLYRECCKLLGIQLRYLTFTQLSQLEKKRKTNFSHLSYWTAQRQQRQEQKKSPNLYSPDHAYAWNFERTKFRNVHRLPPVTWVTYGKNFRCVVAKWVNRLNWKKPVSLVWSGKPVFMVSNICLKVLCKLVSANSKELKKLYNHWIGLP